MFNIRTDLAVEAKELWQETAEKQTQLEGVIARDSEKNGYKITTVEITNEKGEQAIGKPVGTYVTSASTKYQTAKITIDNLDATIDLENNSIHATFNMLGAKVTVSGTISI